MKKLPIGIQTFRKMIEEDFLYIDKTKEIYDLISSDSQYYFLSRPRRFGKSLLISTLHELFAGEKHLFEGLWIYDKIDWQPHPVIHIDFSTLNYKTPERLEETLDRMLTDIATQYGIQLDPQRYYNEKFSELIEKLSERGQVAILIDEYDKPIIDKITDQALALSNREILREFYSVIKASDRHIKFTLITGVSKFSKVSVFSGLNNLRDITLSANSSTLLGYTHRELEHYFAHHLEKTSQEKKLPRQELLKQLAHWYNGYSWDSEHFVYNPFSILNFFSEGRFDNYWFSSGTPTFLTKLLRTHNADLTRFDNLIVSDLAFENFEIEQIETTSLLFQTGYLTLKETIPHPTRKRYRLAYPNKEVRDSFLNYLFREYTQKDFTTNTTLIDRLAAALESNDIPTFFSDLKSIIASIPYNITLPDQEAYYHTIIYLILKLIGIDIQSEVQTNLGRIDAVIQTGTHNYIMEFKMGTAEEALQQIKDKQYHQPFQTSPNPTTLIGAGFNPQIRNIDTYLTEPI